MHFSRPLIPLAVFPVVTVRDCSVLLVPYWPSGMIFALIKVTFMEVTQVTTLNYSQMPVSRGILVQIKRLIPPLDGSLHKGQSGTPSSQRHQTRIIFSLQGVLVCWEELSSELWMSSCPRTLADRQIAILVHLSLLPCPLSDSYLCSLSAMDLVD